MANSEELLKQMYDSNLASQKAALQSDYDAALADLDAQKAAAQKQTEHNVRMTKTEADRSAVNAAEYYEAAGLSSGARAQAKVAQDNQLLADLTAIRAAQQQGDINIERQRGLLGQQYAAAIRQAQAENDMAKAQALYEQAKEAEAALRAQQQEAAKLMAEAGDFGLYAQLYGLTPEQVRVLEREFSAQNGGTGTAPYVSGAANGVVSGAALGALGALGKIPDGRDYWAETKAELEKLYPGGVVADRALWDSLLKAYGPELLKDFRYIGSTGYSGGNGGGGDGQLRWNRKD